MKKLLGILTIAALATSVFAQGTIVFNNSNTGLVKQWTSGSDQTLISVPKGGGSVELIAAPKGTALAHPLGALTGAGFAANYTTLNAFLTANPGWAIGGTTTILPFVAGQFNGGTVALGNVPLGAQADYLVVGWTGSFSSYDAALAAGTSYIGVSSTYTLTTGNPSLTPPGTPGAVQDTFTGMTLAPIGVIPEPSVFALAGLGAAALMIFRRRQ